jgi:hypothetical protein
MPLPDLLLSILHRKGATLSIELRRFLSLTKISESISKPGYLKQRMKLNPEAILSLCDFHNASLYREEDMETIKGYLLLAADGTNLNIPTTTETLKLYGTSSKRNVKQQASLGLSCFYDLLNKVILDITVNRCGFDERGQLWEHMKKLPQIAPDRKSITVLDRNYTGVAEFAKWFDTGRKFVIRLRKNDYIRERAQMESNDEKIHVVLHDRRTRPFRDTDKYAILQAQESFDLRVVNIRLAGGAIVSVATNLSEEEFYTDEIGMIYQMRWGLETAFDMLKNNLQIENLTGTKPILIEQDIYACVYLCNLAQDMIADAEAANKLTKKPPGKHKMAVNKVYAVGVLKDELVKAILEPDERLKTEMFAAMIDEIRQNLLPVRPGRHYERNRSKLNGKFPITRKRSF